MGNKPDVNNPTTISLDQYVTNPWEIFVSGLPYLIKARPVGFDYQQLINTGGLSITGGEASMYEQDRFTFNGQVYTMTPYEEQLFAEDVLFTHTFTAPTTLSHPLNWVIGNSYSAPISMDAIKELIINSPLYFEPHIYIYSAGTTSYQPIPLDAGNTIGETLYTEVPAKGVLMVRVQTNQGGSPIPAGTTFTIGKQQLHHGTLSHNLLQQAKDVSTTVNRDVSIRATLAENSNIYDFTAVGLRENASLNADDKYDIPKIYMAQQEGFQLFTTTPASSKLAVSGVPLDTESVSLSFKPQAQKTDYTLTFSQKNEGSLWLKDLKTDEIIDLQQTPSYTFTGTGTDLENRFILYFANPAEIAPMSIENANSNVYVKLSDNRLDICGLTDLDMNAKVYIYNMLGETVFAGTVSQYPQQEFNVNIPKNIYIVSIRGQRNFDFKTVK
jgi:hypothetical protein